VISLVDSAPIWFVFECSCYAKLLAFDARMLTHLDLTDSNQIKMMLPTELLVLIFSFVQAKDSTPTRESALFALHVVHVDPTIAIQTIHRELSLHSLSPRETSSHLLENTFTPVLSSPSSPKHPGSRQSSLLVHSLRVDSAEWFVISSVS